MTFLPVKKSVIFIHRFTLRRIKTNLHGPNKRLKGVNLSWNLVVTVYKSKEKLRPPNIKNSFVYRFKYEIFINSKIINVLYSYFLAGLRHGITDWVRRWFTSGWTRSGPKDLINKGHIRGCKISIDCWMTQKKKKTF